MARNQRKYDPVGCFFVFWEDCLVSERMFMPDRTYFLTPKLTEPGRGEQLSSCPKGCLFLMSPLSFKTLYIDTKKVINTGYSGFLCDQRWILFMPESTEGVAEGATTAMGQE